MTAAELHPSGYSSAAWLTAPKRANLLAGVAAGLRHRNAQAHGLRGAAGFGRSHVDCARLVQIFLVFALLVAKLERDGQGALVGRGLHGGFDAFLQHAVQLLGRHGHEEIGLFAHADVALEHDVGMHLRLPRVNDELAIETVVDAQRDDLRRRRGGHLRNLGLGGAVRCGGAGDRETKSEQRNGECQCFHASCMALYCSAGSTWTPFLITS